MRHARHVLRFARRVLRHFARNRGLLLAGGVAYNLLLSVVPLFAVLGVVLALFVSPERLLEVISAQARLLAPGQAELLTGAVASLLDDRRQVLVGWVGFGVMLFFSSMAFRMLDDAIAIIFHRHARVRGRRAWVAVLLPYAYVLVVGIALLVLTGLAVILDGLAQRELELLGVPLPLSWAAVAALWAASFIAVTVLIASIYKVLPVVRIAPSRALAGGFVAAALWEVSRRVLVWWFENLSLVDTVYGSIGTVVVVLLYFEAAAVILLLGAQVIAELERSARAGVAWHEDPDDAGAA